MDARTTWDDEYGIAHNLKRRPFWNGEYTIVHTRCNVFKVLSSIRWASGRDLRDGKDADCMACIACSDEGS